MASKILVFVSVLAVTTSLTLINDHEKHDKSEKHLTCQQFTQGLTFNDSHALGTWHLLHIKREMHKGSGDQRCVEFSLATDEERKNLSDIIGPYVEDLSWGNLTLKMQIPCPSANTNDTSDYFLERLENDGSYRTLQFPPPTAKLNLTSFNRNPMRLKLIEGQYLGMMDCHQNFVFLLGKQAPQGAELDDHLKKLIESYWPEEH